MPVLGAKRSIAAPRSLHPRFCETVGLATASVHPDPWVRPSGADIRQDRHLRTVVRSVRSRSSARSPAGSRQGRRKPSGRRCAERLAGGPDGQGGGTVALHRRLWPRRRPLRSTVGTPKGALIAPIDPGFDDKRRLTTALCHQAQSGDGGSHLIKSKAGLNGHVMMLII